MSSSTIPANSYVATNKNKALLQYIKNNLLFETVQIIWAICNKVKLTIKFYRSMRSAVDRPPKISHKDALCLDNKTRLIC